MSREARPLSKEDQGRAGMARTKRLALQGKFCRQKGQRAEVGVFLETWNTS